MWSVGSQLVRGVHSAMAMRLAYIIVSDPLEFRVMCADLHLSRITLLENTPYTHSMYCTFPKVPRQNKEKTPRQGRPNVWF